MRAWKQPNRSREGGAATHARAEKYRIRGTWGRGNTPTEARESGYEATDRAIGRGESGGSLPSPSLPPSPPPSWLTHALTHALTHTNGAVSRRTRITRVRRGAGALHSPAVCYSSACDPLPSHKVSKGAERWDRAATHVVTILPPRSPRAGAPRTAEREQPRAHNHRHESFTCRRRAAHTVIVTTTDGRHPFPRSDRKSQFDKSPKAAPSAGRTSRSQRSEPSVRPSSSPARRSSISLRRPSSSIVTAGAGARG